MMEAFAFQLDFNEDSLWQMQRPHFHDSLEVLLCLSDGVDFFLEQAVYHLHRGTLVFITEGGIHRSFSTQPETYQRYVLHCPLTTLEQVSTPRTNLAALFEGVNCCLDLTEQATCELAALMADCLPPAEDEEGRFAADIERNLRLARLLLYLCRLLSGQQSSPARIDSGFARVAPILRYIDQHLDQPLPLETIAASFYVSKYHLCHLFKQSTGFTVVEYINRVRVKQARKLLRAGVSVRQTGEQTGFASNAHFIRTFKQLVGLTPGQYAKTD